MKITTDHGAIDSVTVQNGACVLPSLIELRAKTEPDRIFLQEVDGPSCSYSELDKAARKWGRALRALEVARHEHVLTFLNDPIDAVACWIGIGWIGAREVPVNLAYRGPMLRHVLALTEPVVIVISSIYLERLLEVRDSLASVRKIVVVGSDAAANSLPGFPLTDANDLLDAAPDIEWHAPAPRDISAILFTSGSTGPSKGVVSPWGIVHQTATQICPSPAVGPDDIFYHCLPLFHLSGKAIIAAMAQANGKIVIRRKFSGSNFWSDVVKYKCTTTFVVGSIVNIIFQAARHDPRANNSPLRNILGTPLPAEMEWLSLEFGVRFHTWYGSTEVGVVTATSDWCRSGSKSCGQIVQGREARIVDGDDQELPIGAIGELIVRNTQPWTMNDGYWKMPAETVKAWRNLWFHTGDAFYRDSDNNFYFVDRWKDVIRRRGENISSYEVEVAVTEHPEVLESAAFAVPSQWGGDEVMVAVVRKEGSTLSGDELIAFLMPRMPEFMVPRYLEFVPSLPKTDTEKVRKTELRSRGIQASTWDREGRRTPKNEQ